VAEFTDDECIAIAQIHGADLIKVEACNGMPTRWYINRADADADVVTRAQMLSTGYYFFRSPATAARAYCEYYKLLEDHNAEA
jgi:hypothetical protein